MWRSDDGWGSVCVHTTYACDGVQVLDFRKLDANMFTLSCKPVDVTRLIREACHHCRAFMLPTVGLRYRVWPTGVWAQLDSRRVHQIVTNGLR